MPWATLNHDLLAYLRDPRPARTVPVDLKRDYRMGAEERDLAHLQEEEALIVREVAPRLKRPVSCRSSHRLGFGFGIEAPALRA